MGNSQEKGFQMGAFCSTHDHGPAVFNGMSDDYRRRLWIVIALNAIMFLVEMTMGHVGKSQALLADSLDFFADAATYGLSLALIGAPLWMRTLGAQVKAVSLLAMGVFVAGSLVWRMMQPEMPVAGVMGVVGFMALAANVASVLLLVRYKDGDANVRSVWLCSRNDAIGNVLVMLAALSVWGTATMWPDIVVAALMTGLFLSSAVQILRQAAAEKRGAAPADAHDHGCCGHDHGHHGHKH
jgi:Co/Zn/Cd efflux system component